MVHDDSQAPATKQDIQMIKQDVLMVLNEIRDVKTLMLAQDDLLQKQIGDLSISTKDDIEEAADHMLTAIEDLRHDVNALHGHHNDKILNHEKRITVLEVAHSNR